MQMAILNGWKEIADYLQRGVRTVQRWEEIGLPVRRPRGQSRSAVVAMSDDVDHWVKSCPFSIQHFDRDLEQLEAKVDSLLRERKEAIAQVRLSARQRKKPNPKSGQSS